MFTETGKTGPKTSRVRPRRLDARTSGGSSVKADKDELTLAYQLLPSSHETRSTEAKQK